MINKNKDKNKNRGKPGLNRQPWDLQSPALPLSHCPFVMHSIFEYLNVYNKIIVNSFFRANFEFIFISFHLKKMKILE